jgi:hypothetical protein
MNRISLRTKYVGADVTLHGKTGWAPRPAHADTWDFHAADATRVPCNAQDTTVWLGESANAA